MVHRQLKLRRDEQENHKLWTPGRGVKALHGEMELKPVAELSSSSEKDRRVSAQSRESHLYKKQNNCKPWSAEDDERLRQWVISNRSIPDFAADFGRTVSAVKARAYVLGISLGHSRFIMKAKAKGSGAVIR
jgi:hypothetical protein